MIFFPDSKFRLLVLSISLFTIAQPLPIHITDGDAAETAAPVEKTNKTSIVHETLERLIGAIGHSPRQAERMATELLTALLEKPHDGEEQLAIRLCLDWGADASIVEGEHLDAIQMTTLASIRKDLEGGCYETGFIEDAMVDIALALIMEAPTPEHLDNLLACTTFIATHNDAPASSVCGDPHQPLLHRFASLLPHEKKALLNSTETPLLQPLSLAIKYLVATGTNINTLNHDKKTVLDIVIDAAYPERSQQKANSDDCTLYRRPQAFGRAQKNPTQHVVDAAAFLIECGARHGSSYLENTKRQHPLSAAAARRTARFLCATPYTAIADALLSHNSELLSAEYELLQRKEVITSILSAAALSSNIHALRQLVDAGFSLNKHSSLLWSALTNQLHDDKETIADAQELLSLQVPLNKRDALGNTPLHYAVSAAVGCEPGSPQWELVALLIKNGASIKARNMRGQSPLSMANGPLRSFMRQQ